MKDQDIPIVVGVPFTPSTPQAVLVHTGLTKVRAAEGSYQGLSEEAFRALDEQGFTRGLAEALERNKQAFPLRIVVIDNSGSMASQDGHRFLETSTSKDIRVISCTRWAEMVQTIDYNAEMAALLKNPTIFRLLNNPGQLAGPQHFSVAERGEAYLDQDVALAKSVMKKSGPIGVTPLTHHVQEIRQQIVSMEPQLKQDGSKVAVILATDGLPSNSLGVSDYAAKQDFSEALRSLEGLPVWIVVRLFTDQDEVVDYWSNLDTNLELSLEVLDDFVAEAEEVHEHNPWLNYGLPLHRIREMGFYHRIFDLLDERKLSKDELKDFFRLLFGEDAMKNVADPQEDWSAFLSSIQKLVAREKKQWNSKTKRVAPWIDMGRLKKAYRTSVWSRMRH